MIEVAMHDLAPQLYRQRLLVEGYYTGPMPRDRVSGLLLGAAAHLGLRVYAEPVVFSPASGMGRKENQGFDAFVPLIDSGISAYIWTEARFFSVLLYTCKGFESDAAIRFIQDHFAAEGEVVSHEF